MFQDALSTFDVVARDYEAFKYADEAVLGRARIYRDRGEIEKAVAEAGRVMGSRYSENVFEAVLFQGDCRVFQGRLDEAFETYDRVGKDWVPQYAQEAYFHLGEISLYRGEFDEAQSYYNVTLRQYPDEPRANDALDRLLLITGSSRGEAHSPELAEFGRALLLQRQGRLPEAAAMLRELGGMDSGEPLRSESLISLSRIYVEQGLLDEAIRTYKFVGDSLETPAAASALEAIGDIYLATGRTEAAVRAYEDVILKFPESVSAGEARRKIDLATREPDDEA
jgi:tetratricopeptide (TPR) repeat protein